MTIRKKKQVLGQPILKNCILLIVVAFLFMISCGQRMAKELYNAIWGDHTEWVKELLDAGADPNYCIGESGWIDSNPLNVVAEDFYDTYAKLRSGETIPDPPPDVAILNLLLKAGADINRRPYIWNRVFKYNNENFKSIKYQRKADNESTEPEAMKKQIENFIEDANRLLKAFLEAGADVDKKGHPYPFSSKAMYSRINDKQANEYFAKGSRAINIAIGKGIVWESQVDLLLKYTKLDEESLNAAKRSNDPKMIEKINRLWQKQNKMN